MTLALVGLIPCGLWFALGFTLAIIGLGRDARRVGDGTGLLSVGGGMCFMAFAGYLLILWNAS